MSKIQGKQIADGTITQDLLNLATPLSGDTTSGATVGYVNSRFTGGEAVTIGPAEDGDYTDGIFTDFTTGTTVGVAVDRFNEMFKLLAPTPPSGVWTTAFGTPLPTLSTGTITAREIVTGTSRSGIVTSTLTPSFTIASTVGTGINARTKDGTFVFTIRDFDGSVKETKTINSGSTTDNTGILRYTVADPYAGVSGQAGFWTGVTDLSGVSFTSGSITAGTTARNLYFEHPTGIGKTGTTFYVDNVTANTPSVTTLVMGTLPTMTRFVSGVPSLATSATFPITSFSIPNACTYFYAPSPIWSLSNVAGITAITGDITNTLASVGDTGLVGAQTVTIANTYTTSIGFTIQAKNRSNTLAGATTGVTYNNFRYDGSSESSRLVSGAGTYPAGGWGGTWGTNSGTSLVTNTEELQMLNGSYIYPSADYTIYGGPNYTGLSGIRWATFNLGTFSSNNAFTLNIVGSTNITSVGQANLYIEVIISGATTYWADGNAAFSSGTFPGVGSNGIAAVSMGYLGSSAILRRIVFGTPTYSGAIIVRIGFTGNPIFTGLTATEIV